MADEHGGRVWWLRIVDLHGARVDLGLGLEITRLGKFADKCRKLLGLGLGLES